MVLHAVMNPAEIPDQIEELLNEAYRHSYILEPNPQSIEVVENVGILTYDDVDLILISIAVSLEFIKSLPRDFKSVSL